MYTAAGVVTNLKQLTYRVPGTFKFNKSNFICSGNGRWTRGGRGAPAKWTVRFIFLSLSTIAERFMSAPVRRTAIPIVAVCLFFYFIFISHFTLFRSVHGRSLTFERVPRGPQCPVRANNTRKLHWDSFYLVLFFSTG